MVSGLLAAAPAAPVVFGAGELLILFAWLVLFCLLYTYRYTLGALLLGLAHRVDDIWIVGGTLAHILETLDHAIQAAIGFGLIELEQAAGKVWEAMTVVVDAIGDAFVRAAAYEYERWASLIGAVIPNSIGAVTTPIRHDLSAFRRQVRQTIESELAVYRRGIDTLRRELADERRATFRGIDALERGFAERLDALRDWTAHRIRADIATLRRPFAARIGRLEQLLGLGILGGVAIAALTRVFPYWQCTNVRRFNKMLCRSPIGALEDLLGIAVLAVGPLSLVDFAEQLQEVMGTAEAGVRWFVTETRA